MIKLALLFLSLTLLVTAMTGCTRDPGPTSTKVPPPTPTTKPTPTPTEELAPATEERLPPEAPPAEVFLGDTWVRPTDGAVMAYVPAGEFRMGSTDEEVGVALGLCNKYWRSCHREWFDAEQPAHTVVLDGFWIDETEVTSDQYAAFLNEKGNQTEEGVPWLELRSEPCRMEYCPIERVSDAYQSKSGFGDHPVVMVTWYGAAAYCKWVGGRLPTEAEWEYAARGPEGYIFPWGDELDGARMNYCDASCDSDGGDESFDDGHARTAPVGSYPEGASWCGLLDMVGNVAEWTVDLYTRDYYTVSSAENLAGPSASHDLVIRGGGWDNIVYDGRAAGRGSLPPHFRFDNLGFRCAASPGE